MLNYKRIHLLVDQGLNSLGIFNERANLHEQIDRAFEHVIVSDINRLMKLEPKSRDAIDTQIAKELSSAVRSVLAKEDGYYVTVVSSSFLATQTVQILLASSDCVDRYDRSPGFYKAAGVLIYNNVTYKEGDIVNVTNVDQITYGSAYKLKTKLSSSVLADPDLSGFMETSTIFSGGTLPVVEFRKGKLIVQYTRKGSFPLEARYYALQALPEEGRLSWCNQKTLSMPENLQHYFIKLVVAHLAITNQRPQENVVNLKTETI